MGRDLQKRKNRSSRPVIKQNKKETLSQNYRRLGLAAKLGKATGGTDRTSSTASGPTAAQDPLAVTPTSGARTGIQSVRVERDADGKILRVLHKANPLNDPLNDIESDNDDEEGWKGVEENDDDEEEKETRVVDLLEEEANRPTEKYKRHQSEREREWIERLVAKHGDDTAKMARDLKLNPMQQTEANIKKRLAIYKENLSN
ncbi:Nucleolar protein 16 [Cytospora mali]|uniref:Nucleolar protein 16 n=1 Tax=Cytospora mali TaxID=578113 RepID=A0A194UM30_CYTMA|nr:Nucleolar protein 16 [Valsa mali var. pyri (nom. inval.)]